MLLCNELCGKGVHLCLGSGIGGRVFFVRPGTDMKELINYLEEQVVMIQTVEALTC